MCLSMRFGFESQCFCWLAAPTRFHVMHVMAGMVLAYAVFMLIFFTCGNLMTGQKFSIQESIKLEEAIKALQLEGAGLAGKMGMGMGIDVGKSCIRLLATGTERGLEVGKSGLRRASLKAASLLSQSEATLSSVPTPQNSIEKNGAADNQANKIVPESIEEETFNSLNAYETD